MRRHTPPRCFVIECKNRVRRAARLECTHLLEIFTFEEQRRAAGRIEPVARQNGRAMNVRTNPIVRAADGIEVEHRQQAGRFSVPKRFPTVIRCSSGSSSEMNLRKRSEKTALRRVR